MDLDVDGEIRAHGVDHARANALRVMVGADFPDT
jgi:hypothetical protein